MDLIQVVEVHEERYAVLTHFGFKTNPEICCHFLFGRNKMKAFQISLN